MYLVEEYAYDPPLIRTYPNAKGTYPTHFTVGQDSNSTLKLYVILPHQLLLNIYHNLDQRINSFIKKLTYFPTVSQLGLELPHSWLLHSLSSILMFYWLDEWLLVTFDYWSLDSSCHTLLSSKSEDYGTSMIRSKEYHIMV